MTSTPSATELTPASSVVRTATGQPLAVLDYLRGLAALGVACYHVRETLWVGWREITTHPERYSGAERVAAWFSVPLPFMGSLVMLFFVISGFCIHWPQADTSRGLSGKAYACRRFFRIYPPYLAAVGISFLTSVVLQHGDTVRLALASATMVQNYPGTGVGGGGAVQLSTNWSLWSLPVEMELYIVYPVLLIALRRWSAGGVLAVTVLVSVVASLLVAGGVTWLRLSFAPFLAIWFGGAWLAGRWRNGIIAGPPGWFGVVACGGFAVACGMEVAQPGRAWTHLGHGGFYFWAVWLLLAHPAWWRGVSSRTSAVLGWLGSRSYSLYLVHFPLFYLLGAGWVARFGERPHHFAVPLLAVIFILPVVEIFYRCIERPSHALAKRAAAAWSASPS